jgi:hypothetical protein
MFREVQDGEAAGLDERVFDVSLPSSAECVTRWRERPRTSMRSKIFSAASALSADAGEARGGREAPDRDEMVI